MRRRLFALLLSAVMIVALLPTAALADEKPALPEGATIEYDFIRSLDDDTADNEYARAYCHLRVRLVNFPDITAGDGNMVTITYTIPGDSEPQQTIIMHELNYYLKIPVEFIGKYIEITASMSRYTGSVTVTTDVVTQRAYNIHDVGVTLVSIGRDTVTAKSKFRSTDFGQKCAISTVPFDPNATADQIPDTCGWQECDTNGQVSFTGLQAGTTYYIWSRYTESNIYIEGEITDSTPFTTTDGEIDDVSGGSVPALRTSGLTGGQGSYVYFGAYQQDALAPEDGATQPTGTEGVDWIEYDDEYFRISPVKWRVLAANEDAAVSGTNGTEIIDTALLLADTALDSQPFHTERENVLWSTSTLRSWLNGYGASENTGGASGTDYSAAGANFITATFSAVERDAIAAAMVQDEVGALIASTARHKVTTGGTYDKVFLLSETEAANTDYGFSAETVGEEGASFPDRLAALNAYNKTKLAYTYGGDEYQVGTTMVEWWLRTMDDAGPYADADDFEAAVNAQDYAGADELVKVGDNGGYFYDQDVDLGAVNVRPAFRLDLDQVIFVRAVNCESSGGAAVARQSALGLNPVPNAAADNNEYALTVYDDSRSGFTVTPDPESKGSETAVTFSYSGAKTGTNEYISAIIKDVATGKILYYGQVKALSDTDDSSGTVTVDISDKFSAGCALYIFNEQVNGEKETNYASRPASVFPLFNVTYAPDDNSTGTTAVDTKAYDETLTLKNAVFTRTGYTQTGWATEKDGAEVYDLGGSYTPNEDVTLYPVWTANTYSVHFDGNDADGGSMSDQPFTYDAATAALTANSFTRTGHHFVKWTVNADGTGASYTDGQEVQNLTAMPGGIFRLYAQWEKDTYTITYASGAAGSGAAIPAATKTYGEPLTLSGSVFTRQGWVQTGWATAENGAKVYDLGGSYTDNAAATLYPAWTQVSTVTFDPNAADGSAVEPQQANTSLTYRLTLAELPVPTRDSDDYRFDGWFTERDGGEQITLDTVFPTDTTVYAHWTYLTTPISAYPITVNETENGIVASSRKRAHEGVRITITVTPDAGWTLKDLTVVDVDGNEIELKQDGNVFTFEMPDSGVTVSGTFAGLRGFVDVPEGKYFYNAVEWAAANGITGGTDATHFSPYAICTRAQIITFLWRAAGCPAPKRLSDFHDVPADAYYAEAVAWAVEKNITGGVTDEIFAPGMPCTRAQAVTFLFRYARRMGLDAVTMQELISGYGDADRVPIYAVSAFNWALASGVVTGNNGDLQPNGYCTRAQIVTMLYRFLTK